MTFRKWPSIGRFADIRKMALRHDITTTVMNAKIKLHGTNAAIRVEDGKFVAQKRTQDLVGTSENAGFRAFVESLNAIDDFDFSKNEGLVFHGEWAGPGVQKTDAVTMIPSKMFFIYAVEESNVNENYLVLDPEDIKWLVDETFDDASRIKVLDWFFDEHGTINMQNNDEVQAFMDFAVDQVDKIGQEDPYIKREFGVTGPGEGLVYYALNMPGEFWRDWLFKVKTEAHSVNKTNNRKLTVHEKPAGVDDIIDAFFTEQRFEQMVVDNELEYNRKHTGNFLKFVMSDAHKESTGELELADFEWKDVVKWGMPKVKAWWLTKCDEL